VFKNKATYLLLALFIFSSCASRTHRGVVAMKIDEKTAHIGLSYNEVSIGDHVQLYTNKCSKLDRNTSRTGQTCEKISKGNGTVTAIINESYSVIKFDDGVIFHEGDFVEKM